MESNSWLQKEEPLAVAVPRDYRGCNAQLYLQYGFRCEHTTTSVSTGEYWTRKPGESHRNPPGIHSESGPQGGTNHSSPLTQGISSQERRETPHYLTEECGGSKAPPTRHGPEVCIGDGSREEGAAKDGGEDDVDTAGDGAGGTAADRTDIHRAR